MSIRPLEFVVRETVFLRDISLGCILIGRGAIFFSGTTTIIVPVYLAS